MTDRSTQLLAAVITAILTLSMHAPIGAAFSGSTAASWADAHWSDCLYGTTPAPPSPYVCFQNDCTNFSSESLHAGGYSFVNSNTDPNDRWYWYSTTARTLSWYSVSGLYYFLVYYDQSPTTGRGGGDVVEITKAASPSDTYNSLSKGDLLFMDWTDDGALDHIRIEVGWGTPPKFGKQPAYNDSYWATGDWADQHSPGRYHSFWNGYYEMDPSLRATVRIYQVHIDSANI